MGGDSVINLHNLRQFVPAVLSLALVLGATAAILVLFGVSLGSRRARSAGANPAAAARLGALQAVATSTPSLTPVALTPQQFDCLGFFGGLDGYQHSNVLQQQGMLRAIQNCVNGELGLPPAPAPTRSRAAARSAAAAGVPTPLPLERAGAGFIGTQGSAPTAAGQYGFSNAWSEDNPSKGIINVTVWAGNETVRDPQTGAIVDRSQGVVWVIVRNANFTVTAGPYLPTPGKDGPVMVVGAVGETLELKAKDGTMFYFDVPSQTFVSSLPAASPTPPQGRGTRGGPATAATVTRAP